MENCRTFFSNKTKEKDEHIDEQDQWKILMKLAHYINLERLLLNQTPKRC